MISQIRVYTIHNGEMNNSDAFQSGHHSAARKDRRAHRRHLGESAAKRIYLGQGLQRQGGDGSARAESTFA
jgi:hypothetical protein